MSPAQHTPGPLTAKQIGDIARQHGGFYEVGAWRFPSPAKKEAFLAAIAKATGSTS